MALASRSRRRELERASCLGAGVAGRVLRRAAVVGVVESLADSGKGAWRMCALWRSGGMQRRATGSGFGGKRASVVARLTFRAGS